METVRVAERPNLLWVRVHTDEGVAGLGETFFGAGAVEAHVHDWIAPRVMGRDPLAIEGLAREVLPYVGRAGAGAEARAASAFDMALWDLWGRATGQPVAQLLGGVSRDAIRTYNTCAGPGYIAEATGQAVANFGIGAHRLDDLDAFLHRADELALDLLEEGITGMKIWPFDGAAERTGGLDIPADEMRAALDPFERIRAAVGDRMDVMVELHGLWSLAPALRIAEALRPFGTYWHEDPIRMEGPGGLRRYAAASPAPVAVSETLGGLGAFRDLMLAEAAGVVILDVSWCGGLSAARKVAALAEAWDLPVAPHDCTGPVSLAASTHLSLHLPNAVRQESVRAFLRTWYRDLVTALPEVRGGMITAPPGPGLGLELLPDLDRAFTVARKRSERADR